MNSEYKILAKNTVIFAGAGTVSKALKLLIVPFYTYHLTTVQYGSADTIMTTVNLIIPVILLGLNEAALRFSFKKEYTPESVFANCCYVLTITSTLGLLLYFPLSHFMMFKEYWWQIYLILVSGALESLLLFYTRGTGRYATYAIAGVINTIFLLASNIIFLRFMDAGEKGYLVSFIIASAAGISFMLCQIGPIRPVRIDADLISKMLKYSLPLIPNAFMWWVMNSSDRYIIVWMLGVSYVGIYGIAYKIPAIVSALAGLFHQAWQLSFMKQNETSGLEAFYKSVLDAYSVFLFTAASVIMLLIRPIVYTFDTGYIDAAKYAPFLVAGAVFSALSGFVGINYTVSEKTLGAFTSSAAGATVNVLLNLILTAHIGMQGTAISTFISFYLLWLIRSVQTKREMGLHTDYRQINLNTLVIVIEALLIIQRRAIWLPALCLFIIVCINRRSLIKIISTVKANK